MVEMLAVVAALALLAGLLVTTWVLSARALIKRPSSWLVREVGHRWWSVAVVFAVGCIPLPVGVWDLARVVVGSVMLGLVLGAVRAHDLTICEKCIAAWPLDAPARAEQRQGWLRFWHHSQLLLVGSIAAVTALTNFVPVATMIQIAVFATAFLLRDRARAIHTPLQPWCPTCGGHDDDGPGDDETVTPDPDPAGARR